MRTDPSLEANLVGRVNVGDMLTRTAWRLPDREAVIDGRRRWSYRELNDEVNRLAHGLLAVGYRRGDALALVSGNSIEFLVVYYACAKIGVVCVPVNLAWGAREMAYVLAHSAARGVVVETQLVPVLTLAIERASATIAEVIVAPGTASDWAPGPGGTWTTLDEFTRDAPPDEPLCLVDDRDALSYLYTSGTTSAPKGVVSSHVAVYIESLNAPLVLGFSPSDRSVVMMPLFHTAQLNGFTTGLFYLGGTAVLMRSFEPETLLSTIETERITQIFALPMMYRAMMDHSAMARYDLSSLRLALYAMAPMPETDLRRAMELFNCEFALGFGQTEMNPLTTVFPPDRQLTHPGSVGSPVPNVQVGIMDDSGRLLPVGKRARSSTVDRTRWRATCAIRWPRRKHSAAAGSTPATSVCSTTTGCCGSATGART